MENVKVISQSRFESCHNVLDDDGKVVKLRIAARVGEEFEIPPKWADKLVKLGLVVRVD